MKKILFITLLFVLSISFVNAYTIDYVNNDVYIDIAQAKILVTPYQLSDSGCAYINVTNKNNNNQYDLVIGSDENASVSSIGLWTSVVNGSNITWFFQPQNISTIITTYDNKTVWYETNGIQMNKNTNLYVQMCMNIVKGTSGKYDVGVHLSSQTLAQAISGSSLFLLDPWWNSTAPVEFGGQQFPNYWSILDNGSSTTYIRPIFPYQNNYVEGYSMENNGNGDVGRITATVTGLTFNSSGKIGGCYQNAGGENELNIPYLMDFANKNYTIDYDFYTDSCEQSNKIIWVEGSGTMYNRIISNTIQLTDNAGTNSINFTCESGNWSHITIIRLTNKSNYMYKNGALVGSLYTNYAFTVASPIRVFRYTANCCALTGKVDNFRIYDRAFTVQEANDSYNNNLSRLYQKVNLQANYPYTSNLINAWFFNNNSLDEKYYSSGTNITPTAVFQPNGGINFTANNSFVSFPDRWDMTSGNWTMETKIRLYNLTNQNSACAGMPFVSQVNNDQNWDFYFYDTTQGANSGKVAYGKIGVNEVQGSVAINQTNVDYHIVMARDSSRTYIWVNNVLALNTTTMTGWTNTANNLRLGSNVYSGCVNNLRGIQYYFKIYNFTFYANEVNYTFNNNPSGLNASATMFYSNKSILSYNISAFTPNLSASDNNVLIKFSANNGTNYTSWLSMLNNSQNISVTQGNVLSFIINLSNVNSTVQSIGIINVTFNFYSIIGQALYNSSIINNMKMLLIDDNTDTILSTTNTNSSGGYTFSNLNQNSYYVVLGKLRNATTNITGSKYFYTSSQTTNGTIEFLNTGTTQAIFQCSSISISSGCSISLLNNNFCSIG